MFGNVLIGVDGQAGGHDAVALAKQLAAADARLTFAHVYGYSTFGGGALATIEHQDSNRLLKRERDAAARDVGLLAHLRHRSVAACTSLPTASTPICLSSDPPDAAWPAVC